MKNIYAIALSMMIFFANAQQNPAPNNSRVQRGTIQGSSLIQLTTVAPLTIVAPQMPIIVFGPLTPPPPCLSVQSEPVVLLEFNSDGQLVSDPPEQLRAGNNLQARVNLNEGFWLKRKHEVIERYISTLANLENSALPFRPFNFGISPGEIDGIKDELAYELLNYLPNSGMDRAHISYYTAMISRPAPRLRPVTNYIPRINTLIDPVFRISYRFYNSNGNRIDYTGELLCIPEPFPDPFLPCCDTSNRNPRGYYLSQSVPVPRNTSTVEYDLTLENVLTQKVMANSSITGIFPPGLKAITAGIDSLTIRYDSLVAAITRLKKAPLETGYSALNDSLRRITDTKNRLLNTINSNAATPAAISKREWIKHWLWYTKGIPRVDPFAVAKASESLSSKEKARYELFEMMLNKEGFKLDAVTTFTEKLGALPEIKAALTKEAAAPKAETPYQDYLLYKGILKSSENSYMRHHNVKNDYIIMGNSPRKEINETQRLYVLLANKNPEAKFLVSVTATDITTDLSSISIGLLNTANELADKAALDKKKDNLDEQIAALIVRVAALGVEVKPLIALGTAPVYPILYDFDPSPTYISDLLEHDYFFDAPIFVNYSIKSIASDNTEKEVKASRYRMNKLYRLRFKAGLLYSTLKVNDYTSTGPNQYTLSNPTYGIDGTFGVQVYFRKQDIRMPSRAMPHVYLGLSMKKITENFYAGIGIEPWSGLAIDLTSHIGKREKLVGQMGIPTDIRQSWGFALGITVLIDAVLFTKIFTFGSSKSLIGF